MDIKTTMIRTVGMAAVSLVALVGCGGGDNPNTDAVASDTSGPAANSLETAVQGTWMCEKGSVYTQGARMYLFNDSDREIPFIRDGARVDVSDGTWTVMTDSFKGSGTYTVDGDTWTLTPDLGGAQLVQPITGVPETTEEAASEKMILVDGADPDTRTRMVMSSPTTITFYDEDEDSTNCYKY